MSTFQLKGGLIMVRLLQEMEDIMETLAVLGAVGFGLEISKKIKDAIRALGGNDEDLRLVLTQKGLDKKIAEVIMGMTKKQQVGEEYLLTYKVIVDYSKSLPEMIEAGNYDLISNNHLGEKFSLQGVGKQEVELVLLHFKRAAIYASPERALEFMEEIGVSLAKIEHLLAFGAAYPEIQEDFGIISLDCVEEEFDYGYRSHSYPMLLSTPERGREFNFSTSRHSWTQEYRFLALLDK